MNGTNKKFKLNKKFYKIQPSRESNLELITLHKIIIYFRDSVNVECYCPTFHSLTILIGFYLYNINLPLIIR